MVWGWGWKQALSTQGFVTLLRLVAQDAAPLFPQIPSLSPPADLCGADAQGEEEDTMPFFVGGSGPAVREEIRQCS